MQLQIAATYFRFNKISRKAQFTQRLKHNRRCRVKWYIFRGISSGKILSEGDIVWDFLLSSRTADITWQSESFVGPSGQILGLVTTKLSLTPFT